MKTSTAQKCAINKKDKDLQVFFDLMGEFIFILDLSGKILFANKTVEERLGYPRHELLEMNVLEVHPSDRRDEAGLIVREMVEGKRDICPIPLLTRSGVHIPVETKITFGCWKDREVLFGISRDISNDISARKEESNYRRDLEKMVQERTVQLTLQNKEIEKELVLRRKSEEETRRRLDFEQMLSDLASRFVLDEDLDEAIDHALKELGLFTSSSRCYLFQIGSRSLTMSNTHEWCAQGVQPQREELQDLPLGTFQWWIETLEKEGQIDIPDISEMLPSAKAERELLERQGIKSLHVFAVYVKGKIGGFVGFDNCINTGSWSKEDLVLLNMFASLLGTSLTKGLHLREVVQSGSRYHAIVEDKSHFFARLEPDMTITFTNSALTELFGLDKDGFRGKNLFNVMGPEKTQSLSKSFKPEALKESWFDWEEKVISAERRDIWIQWRFSGIWGIDGELEEIQAVGSDITDARSASDKIEKALEFNRRILDSSTMGILTYHSSGECLQANETAAKILGTTIETLMGYDFRKDPFWERTGLKEAAEKAFITGEPQYCGVEGEDPFGEEIDLYCHLIPFFSDEGKHILVMFEDLTAVRFATREKARADTTSAVIEAMSVGILVHDMEGTIIATNSFFEKGLGISKDRLIGAKFQELILANSMPHERLHLLKHDELSRKGQTFDPVQFHLETEGRSVRCYECSVSFLKNSENKKVQVVKTFKDITHILESEKKINETRAMSQAILTASTDGILLIDNNYIIKMANTAFSSRFGMESGEICNRNILHLIPEELRGKIQNIAEGVFHSGRSAQYEYKRADLYLHNAGFPMFDEMNNIKGMAIISRDLTEHHLMEEKLKEQTFQLERSNAELQQFAYVASHDLQEPLRMVSSFLQLLSKKYQGHIDENADTYINFAVDGATRMQILIQDLLSYSRIESRGREFTRVDCNFVFQEILSDLRIFINDNNASVTSEELPVIWADEGQIYSLLLNLIQNGLKYSKEHSPRVHVTAFLRELKWEFSVEDNGIGIDSQFHERIFKIFQRLHGKDEYSGTGIGLAICKRIVDRHKGEIWLDSESGRGSRFYFTIPCRKEVSSL